MIQAVILDMGGFKPDTSCYFGHGRSTISNMIQAVIFDMDGVLIDSEPFWHSAERAVFGPLGITLTDAMCEETTGMRTDAVVAYWYERHPWHGQSLEDTAHAIVEHVIGLVNAQGQALTGVDELLAMFTAKRLPLAIASSSPYRLIDAVVDKLRIRDAFSVMRSATDEVYGKPDPAVYLTTARCLSVPPSDCLVFEDSAAGVQAAKAAGMYTVAVPTASQYDDTRFDIADHKCRSLLDFTPTIISPML